MADLPINEGLEYFKGKENAFIATVETGTSATRAYEVGEYFWKGGKLYEATASIASGTAFTVGTNCKLAVLGDDVSDLKESVNQTEIAAYASFEQKTITDVPIASFDDGANDVPVKKLVVNVDPVQDLHGQDAPYPAGGGKNLLPNVYSDGSSITINGITYTNDDGVIKVAGTPTGNAYYSLFRNADGDRLPIKAGTYTISCAETTANCKINFTVVGGVSSVLNDSQHMYTFTLSNDAEMYINVLTTGSSAVNLSLHVQLESGSTATTWSPYENICPISGHTSAKVTRTGTNLGIVKNLYVGGVDGRTMGNDGVLVCFSAIKGQTYRISGTSGDRNVLYKFRGNMEDIKAGTGMSTRVSSGSLPIILTADETCIYCYYGNSIWSDTIANTMAVFVGDTNQPYEPYQGETYDITFPSEAGTVYGGTLTINEDGNGELVVDRGSITPIVDVLQSINSYGIANFSFGFTIAASDDMIAKSKVISNVLKTQMSAIADTTEAGVLIANRLSGFVRLNSADADTIAKANEWIENNNLIIVYFLETPITYTLTAQQVTTLLGINNIWADTGDIAELTYRAMNNTSAMIKLTKALIASVLDSMTADTALAVNDFRIVGDTLYKVTAPIASGGTLTVGTNVVATTIGAQITALLNA